MVEASGCPGAVGPGPGPKGVSQILGNVLTRRKEGSAGYCGVAFTFDEYQKLTSTTAVYPKEIQLALSYLALGLTGEAGEVANKVKKIIRDHNGKVSSEIREKIIDEIGDVLWYAAQLAEILEAGLSEIAGKNIEKLLSRKDRNKISGSGDNR